MSKKTKSLVPYMQEVSKKKKKKNGKEATFTYDLTGLVSRMYEDNLRLTHENADLREQIAALRMVDGEFIVLEPSGKEGVRDD